MIWVNTNYSIIMEQLEFLSGFSIINNIVTNVFVPKHWSSFSAVSLRKIPRSRFAMSTHQCINVPSLLLLTIPGLERWSHNQKYPGGRRLTFISYYWMFIPSLMTCLYLWETPGVFLGSLSMSSQFP